MKLPKYQQIKNILRQEIISGKFEQGDKFYTESELIAMHNVSSITVIRSLNELVAEGFLVREQGKGTFISRARKGKAVQFSDIEKFPINDDKTTVLSIKKGNDLFYLNKLGLNKDDFYYRIIRIRHTNDTPYIYHQSFIPAKFINLTNKDLDQFTSIYKYFRETYDIHMNDESFAETNEVVFPTPLYISQVLQLKDFEPSVLQIKKTTLTGTSTIIEYVESYKRWDFYKIEINSIK